MFRPTTNTMYVEVTGSYLTPTRSTPEVVNVGAVLAANFVDAGHVMAADPALVSLKYTTSDMLAPRVFVNANVVAPTIVADHSQDDARLSVFVPLMLPSATVVNANARVCARPVNVGLLIGANDVATNAVVAIFVELSPAVGVTDFGAPVNVGLLIGANVPIEVKTNAVVAI
jgi:hypothetical protein